MPLPPSETEDTRTHLHKRTVVCDGFEREDGLWEIEGYIRDDKSFAFPNDYRGTIEPGDPLHHMGLRFVLNDEMEILKVDAFLDKSPFRACPQITPNFQRLVGLKIVAGFNRKVKERLGGVQGCTHLVDLIPIIATTAFQTIIPMLARRKGLPAMPADDKEKSATEPKRPPLINSCHAFSDEGEVVKKRWPEWYKGDNKKSE
tara:strand:- start:148 stop:753 length:606 start_codon:yes stop_codon:yes gene_type:complete